MRTCFGNENVLKETHPICKSCPDFIDCKRSVIFKKKLDKPQ